MEVLEMLIYMLTNVWIPTFLMDFSYIFPCFCKISGFLLLFYFSSLYKENTEKLSIFYPASFKFINLQIMGTLDLIVWTFVWLFLSLYVLKMCWEHIEKCLDLNFWIQCEFLQVPTPRMVTRSHFWWNK